MKRSEHAPDGPPSGALFIRALLQLLGRLPLAARRRAGRTIGLAYAALSRRERRMAELQLSVMLEEKKAPVLAREVFAALGQTLFETLNLGPLLARPERFIDCPRRDLAETVAARGKPVIALTAHTGNWELLAAYMVSLGVPLVTVGRQARGRHLQHVLAGLRARYGVRTLWRGGREGLRDLVRELQPGKVVAALIDQDTYVRSECVPFFSLPARTPSGLVDLGKKRGAIFVSAFIFREAGGRYTIHLEELDGARSTAQILTEYNRRLELLLRSYPAQWVWFHKRWRGSADGRRMSSTEYADFLNGMLHDGTSAHSRSA